MRLVARSFPSALPGACALSGRGRARVNAARPHAHLRAPPKFHPRVRLSLSSRGSRHEALVTRAIVRWGAMGRDGARWGGCAHRFTARPLQTMRPSGHASTRLVAHHTSQQHELSTRA